MSSPILRKLRLSKPPSKEEVIKPFLVDESSFKRTDALSEQDLSSTIPVNQVTLDRAAKYRDKELPKLLRDPINATRDFFLREVAPLALSVSNGLLEATDVLKETFQEDPAVGPYIKRMEDLAYQAVEIKMISFITTLFKLTPDETSRFMVSVYSKELKTDDLISVLSQMLKVSNVPGPEKGSEVRVRQLQAAKDGVVDNGSRRNRAHPKRRKQ